MKKRSFSSFLFLASLLILFQLIVPLEKVSAVTIDNNVLPPSNLSFQLITPSDVKLSWSSVYGATGYNVYGITDGQLTLLGTTTSTSYTFNNLPEGSYSYVVSSLSSNGESGPCAPVDVSIIYPEMTAPATLTGKIQNGNDVVLSWTAVQYAKTYNIYQINSANEKLLIASASTTTYTLTNAAAGSYTYAVSAVNPLYGESVPSASTQLNVIYPTMIAPGNLTYSLLNGNDISLKWNSVSYASGYNIYQIINGQPVLKKNVTSTSVSFTNMPADDYVYEVHSYSDRFGESQSGAQVSFKLTLPTMQSPSSLTYSIANGNDITLRWGTASYATNYKVYQIVGGGKVLKSTLSGTSITYSNMPGGDYTYEVHSYSDRFGESQEETQTAFTLVLPIMQSPSTLAYSITNGNDITLTWGTVPYVTSYKVYQIVDGQKILKSTLSGTSVTYSNMSGGDYTYEIHSYSNRFGESTDGNIISFSLVLPVMQPPLNIIQTIKNTTDFTLNWDTSAYAAGYRVYQIVNGQKVLKSTVTGTTVSYTNMAPGEYNFEVHSYSARFGESADGSTITVTLNGQTMQAPTGLTYAITNGNDITLKWTAVPYATSYKIYQVIDGQPILQKTVTTTSAAFTNMPAGDYDYIIDSVSTLLGESPNGAETTFSLVLPTMAAPSSLTYKIKNGNDVVLTWSAAAYANNYKVYELINGQLVLKTTVSSTTATLVNIPEGDHTYVVTSVSTRFGESQDGSQVSFSLVFPVMLAPGNFTYSIANGNDITLKWNAVTYATSYNIYQIIDGQKILKQTVTGTSVTLANMPEGDYTYEIYSYSSRFGESQDGSQTSFTLVFPIMISPSNLTNTISNGNDITLRWTASSYATAYRVYQLVNGQKILKQTVTGTYATFVNMPAGEYSYEVDSYSSRFGESPLGSTIDFSLIWPVVQPPSLSGTISNINNITLSWQAVSWVNEYRVYEVTNGSQQLLYKGTALSYKIYNLSEGTHNYQVTAYSTRFGESKLSQQVSETIIYPDMQQPTVSLKVLDKTSAQLSWNFVTYANGYNIYEIIDGNPVLLVKNINNLSYTLNNLSYANHLYYVTSFSNSFGESDPSSTVLAKLIVDTEAPVTSAYAPTEWTNQLPAAVTLSSIDKDTGVAATYYSINDSAFTEGTSFTINQEGISKVSFYSVDKVGNIEAIHTIFVKIDRTAPVTTSDAPTNWLKDAVTLNLYAADSQSGIAKTFYSIDGAEYLEGTSFTIQSEGIHTVLFYSVDAAGNIEDVNTSYVKIDRTAPTITMNLKDEYMLGTALQLNYLTADNLSGVVNEKMLVYGPNGTAQMVVNNGSSLQLDKPGNYTVVITVTDAAGNSYITQKQFVVYIPANIQITSKIINDNNGVFTVRIDLPSGFNTRDLDLTTATLNGVNALDGNNGYYNQAKLGQFKFRRSDFTWTSPETVVEFRCYINGYLVIGQTTVKVQK